MSAKTILKILVCVWGGGEWGAGGSGGAYRHTLDLKGPGYKRYIFRSFLRHKHRSIWRGYHFFVARSFVCPFIRHAFLISKISQKAFQVETMKSVY